MHLEIDHGVCEGHGLCQQAAPGLVRLDDNGVLQVLVDEVPAGAADMAGMAVRVCPVTALRLVGEA